MDFQDLLVRYFGHADIVSMKQETLDSGLERVRVDFGLEKDSGRRFGLWALMYMLGAAPDLDVAFKNPAEQEAARNFMDLAARLDDD